MRYPELTDKEITRLDATKCADCDANIYEGPCGGGSINYQCGNERCGSKFNYSLSWERISQPSPMLTDEDSMPIALPIEKDLKQ
jgi:hypothetical protein